MSFTSAAVPVAPPLPASAPVMRWLHLRQVKPSSGVDRLQRRALNLWWIALAAAEETAQGQAMASSFLTLFSGHLSQSDARWLRWRDDMAASAEMRRAYSALYGRFFARGVLKSTLALRNFISLHTQSTPAGAVTVNRLVAGDIPDWIAWDPVAGTYVLCEAKGNLTGTTINFQTATPKCVVNGKEQFERVEVLDALGNQVKTYGWVGASLWATDLRNRQPVFLAFDPEGEGRDLGDNERREHAHSLHRQWLSTLSEGFAEPAFRTQGGAPRLFIKVRAPAAPDLQPPRLRVVRSKEEVDVVVDKPSPRAHADLYVPSLLTRFGLAPVRGRDARDTLLKAQEAARLSGEPVWFVGVSRRATKPGFTNMPVWLSDCGVVSAEGLAIFDLRRVSIQQQFGT